MVSFCKVELSKINAVRQQRYIITCVIHPIVYNTTEVNPGDMHIAAQFRTRHSSEVQGHTGWLRFSHQCDFL